MEYRALGSSGLQVSVVSLGTSAMGGDKWGVVDDRIVYELAVPQGIEVRVGQGLNILHKDLANGCLALEQRREAITR